MKITSEEKEEFLGKAFDYCVENGLENFSIRDLTKATGLQSGSIYYRFDDKDEFVIEVARYGLAKIANEIFDYIFSYKDNFDLKSQLDNILDEIQKHKEKLRFVYQVAASPQYGNMLRAENQSINTTYEQYIVKLGTMLNCNPEIIKPYVFMIIAAILDYTIWDDYPFTKNQIDKIYSLMSMEIKQAQTN